MTNVSSLQPDELFVYYDDLVNYISLKFGNRQVALDVVQETYLHVLQKPEQFRNLTSPIAFLKKVSVNIALDYFRKGQTYQKYFDVLESEPSAAEERKYEFSEPELQVVKRQYEHLILKKIAVLPPVCQDVFLLIQFYGMSQVEVAQQLGISRTMVIKHLTKALQSFLPIFVENKAQ